MRITGTLAYLFFALWSGLALAEGSVPSHGEAAPQREAYQNQVEATRNRLNAFLTDFRNLQTAPNNPTMAAQMRWEAFLELVGTEQQYLSLRAKLAKADEDLLENLDLSGVPWTQRQNLRRLWSAAIREQLTARNSYDEKLAKIHNWISTYNQTSLINDPNLAFPWLDTQVLIRASRREYQTDGLRNQITRLLAGTTDPRAVKYLAERNQMIQRAAQLRELIDGKATEAGYAPGWMALCQKSEALVRSLANRAG